MDTIKGRIMFALSMAKTLIGMGILLIPAIPYWIITGEDLIEKYIKWRNKKEDEWWDRRLKSK